ncbi:TIGR01212 family radical SAM protein [Treponema sp.]|uniref:TIGR01212 family radical SAM protein n=1 Tax=Treponema sp. TaxID=166 RepID=UPI0025CD33D3|nr:TIGR01212 family radical SAM protein [Treponema sp.]MCR5217651.1 TIGR01212 family radical SAM protein [Treponema sp.]
MKIKTASEYLTEIYGTKVYKLSLSSGCSCPNRDGKISYGGCTFCSEGGSGDFAVSDIEEAKKKVIAKFPKSIPEEQRKFIAYYQSYTNTYGDTDRLYSLYSKVLSRPDIVILSLGTRPDCINEDVMDMLKKLSSIKPVWVELGLQTIHEESARHINRGYSLDVFEKAYRTLRAAGITVIVHVILGLPGESEEMMLDTVRYLASLNPPLEGIKIQLLHVLKNTPLEKEYREHPFKIFSMEEYAGLVVKCLKILPPQTVIHRMTGDGPKKILVAPEWSGDKKKVINYMNKIIDKS